MLAKQIIPPLSDRLAQSLSQLSIAQLDDQFPVEDVIYRAGQSIEDMLSECLQPTPFALRQRQRIASLTMERAVPVATLDDRIAYHRMLDDIDAPAMTLESGESMRVVFASDVPDQPPTIARILDIGPALASGAFGATYRVHVHPNASLHYVTTYEPVLSRLRTGIPAVAKKSPIAEPIEWLRLAALIRTREAIDVYGADRLLGIEGPMTRARRAAAFERSLLVQAYERAHFLEVVLDDVLVMTPSALDTLIARRQMTLARRANDVNNPAYIDALGYYLGSRIAENGLSPFYPLLYGTLVAADTRFFDDKDVQLFGEVVNHGFRVQFTILQPLEDTVAHVLEQRPRWFDTDKIMALLAQVTFGLAVGQHCFSLVHNDLHVGNIMYVSVDESLSLFYRRRSTGKLYRVPTYGRVYKVIDFNLAAFAIDPTLTFSSVLTAELAAERGKQWNAFGRGNDLARLATSFLAYNVDASRDVTLSAFLNRLISCSGGKTSIVSRSRACKTKDCRSFEESIRPFLVDSDCPGGVPVDVIEPFFDRYLVSPAQEEIMLDAATHVYFLP